MQKTIKKKTVICCIGVAAICLLVSFTSAVGFQAVSSSQRNNDSPLYNLRLGNIINPEQYTTLSSLYIGKDKPIEIPLPTRELLSEDVMNQLSSTEIKNKICLVDSGLVQKWENILSIAKNFRTEINSMIRQDYSEFQSLITKYYSLSAQEAKAEFYKMIQEIDTQEALNDDLSSTIQGTPGNITSGFFCNITSGQFCQITSQPLCKFTTQPICSITKGFVCWTIFGPICPSVGIKCHPPTSRPTLCSIFASASKFLKLLVITLILAAVIFVPLGILSLVFITVVNPDRCTQIHNRITTWFNCTTPG